jgi:hypothetical protein
MYTQRAYSHLAEGLSRRELLQMGLAAGLTVSVLPLSRPAPLWGAEAGQPKRGGILRVRGYDPVHFDHHLTNNAKTNTTLSFVHSTLLRFKGLSKIKLAHSCGILLANPAWRNCQGTHGLAQVAVH